MSVKSTILFSDNGEHIYIDTSHHLTDNSGKRKCAITLEFSKDAVKVDWNSEDELIITITDTNSELYKLLLNVK